MEQVNIANIIKSKRLSNNLSQNELGEIIGVSNKTISKWENGKGLPDIAIIPMLANALNISVNELYDGKLIENKNKACNISKSKCYVCPKCSNLLFSMGEASIFCCGEKLVALKLQNEDEEHIINTDIIEDEIMVTINHPMTKEHYIKYVIYAVYDRLEVVTLYPEQDAIARFFFRGRGEIYIYCSRHSLYKK